MPNQSSLERKPGRPRTGRQGFLVRMSPTTHAALVQMANEEGMRLGEWLDEKIGSQTQNLRSAKPKGGFSRTILSRRFRDAAGQTSWMLRTLYDLYDEDPAVAKEEMVFDSLHSLVLSLRPIFDVLRAAGLHSLLKGYWSRV